MIWLRYGLVFLAVAIGVSQIIALLALPQDQTIGGAAQLMVPAMIAALIEGQRHAKIERNHPGGAKAWNFAFAASGIAFALNIALAYSGPNVAPEFAKLAIAMPGSQQFMTLLVFYAIGYLLCNRFFYGLGVGNQLSLMQKKDNGE
ncbi:MAG: ABZJ_00895 family protein [Pseudomonadota bacterium]